MEIKPDQFYSVDLNFDGGTYEAIVNAKYDRLDRFRGLGLMMLKVYIDDQGFALSFIEHEAGQKLHDEAEIPIIDRDFIYKSEYDLYLEAQANRLSDELFDIDIDEATIYEQLKDWQGEDGE